MLIATPAHRRPVHSCGLALVDLLLQGFKFVQDAEKFAAERRHAVLHARRQLRKRLALENAERDILSQAVVQHLSR